MKIPGYSLSIPLILAMCGNLLIVYPLSFQQGEHNRVNLLSGYQNRPQSQILWIGNIGNFPPVSNTFPQKQIKLLGDPVVLPIATNVPAGTVATLPTATTLPPGSVVQLPSETATDPSLTGPIGATGLPIGNAVSSPLPNLSPCAAAALLGLLGNLLLSSLCCSTLGALSPCSSLGLGSPLSTVGLPVGGILPNLGVVPSTQVANLFPNVANLPGLGGCPCNGLNAQLSTPCCNSPVINIILAATPTVPGVSQVIPNPSETPVVIPDPTAADPTSLLPNTLPVVGKQEFNRITLSSPNMS